MSSFADEIFIYLDCWFDGVYPTHEQIQERRKAETNPKDLWILDVLEDHTGSAGRPF